MWEQMGTKKLQMIAVSDIGFFAASAFFNEEEWKDRAMSLAGDELTQKEANEVFRKVTGRDMILAPCIVGKGVKAIKKDTVGDMFRWFEEVGYGADVQGCRELNPGMLDWEGWVRGSWFGKDGKA